MTAPPKLFVSYSWTSPDHEAWVLQLSTDLRESGIDVVLDKWDLKEGHDAHAFMEKMVNDPEVQKVVLVCDQVYVTKANARTGGVGTEAQIVSGEIYAKREQEKFVAAVTERGDDGKPCLPAYYASRIFIDFSDSASHSESFERLLRWVFDQPLHRKPALGTKPAFLAQETGGVVLATSSRFRRAIDALTNGRPNAVPAAADYLRTLAVGFEEFRLDPDTEPFDDAVVESIEAFRPYRNEAIEIFQTLAEYADAAESRRVVHRFLEEALAYCERRPETSRWSEWGFDNFQFIVHELFLYALAAFIRHERFDTAAQLIETPYYLPEAARRRDDVMGTFQVFRYHLGSLQRRNQRLALQRLSVRADLLKQRCTGVGVEFRHLMEVDLVLFLRSVLAGRSDYEARWWPETLLYASTRSTGTFETFARARSRRYFDRVKVLLGVNAKEELAPILQAMRDNPDQVPRWGFDSFSPSYLLGFDKLATTP